MKNEFMSDNNTVNFEMYKNTHCHLKAKQQQRLFDWEVKVLIEFLKQGKIDDAFDLIVAGLLIKQNRTTNFERCYFIKILKEVGKNGYAREEKELRWRLQKALKKEK